MVEMWQRYGGDACLLVIVCLSTRPNILMFLAQDSATNRRTPPQDFGREKNTQLIYYNIRLEPFSSYNGIVYTGPLGIFSLLLKFDRLSIGSLSPSKSSEMSRLSGKAPGLKGRSLRVDRLVGVAVYQVTRTIQLALYISILEILLTSVCLCRTPVLLDKEDSLLSPISLLFVVIMGSC